MNVLFITAGHFPDGTAQIARIKCFAKAVLKTGGKPFVLGIHPSGLGKQNSVNAAKSGTEDGVQYLNAVSPKLFYLNPFLKYFLFVWSICYVCFWYIAHYRKYDVVYFHQPRLTDSLLILILSKVLKRKSFVDQTELFSTIEKRARVEEWVVAKCATGINCISKPIIKFFNSELNRYNQLYNISIIVDFDRFPAFEAKEMTHTIGYLGTFAQKDGLIVMLRGFKLARKNIPQLRLKLIGNSSNCTSVQKEISQLGIDESVDFVGSLAYHQIPEEITKCDTLIMNRTRSDFAHYGYPTKLGEYFATGRPVLMSDSGGFANDYVHLDTVIKYQADSQIQLSEAILWRYGNKQKAKTIGINGRKHALSNLSIESQGSKFNNFLESLYN